VEIHRQVGVEFVMAEFPGELSAPMTPATATAACRPPTGMRSTGLPLDGPDPECVKGYGEIALSKVDPGRVSPKSSLDHSHIKPVKNGPIMLP
jgi:hypothetical protein